jgi:hypothetical protein
MGETTSDFTFQNNGIVMQWGILTPTGGDATFDLEDISALAEVVPFVDNAYTGISVRGQVVPEPASLALLAAGLAGTAPSL